jgi:hypothetical protein
MKVFEKTLFVVSVCSFVCVFCFASYSLGNYNSDAKCIKVVPVAQCNAGGTSICAVATVGGCFYCSSTSSVPNYTCAGWEGSTCYWNWYGQTTMCEGGIWQHGVCMDFSCNVYRDGVSCNGTYAFPCLP